MRGENEALILRFCNSYSRYIDLVDKIKKVAVYYDSRYVLNNKCKHPTSLIGYLKFRDNFLDSGICDTVAS